MSTDALTPPLASAHARAKDRARARRVAGVLGATLAGVVMGLVIAVGVSLALGYRTFAVLSGSMEPNIHTGDAVVDKPIRPLEARVGDVVTFKDPGRGGELVTHRLRSIRPNGATVAMITKGDANTTVERWNVPVNGSVGRVTYRLPHVGRAMAVIRGRYGRLLLIALPALLLGVYELTRIWRRP
jgi:signal peptidase